MKKISLISLRLIPICLCLLLAVLSIAYKLIALELEDGAFLQNEGKKRYIKYRTINPLRGAIFDRNNIPLAVSIVNYDLYALRGLNRDKFLKVKDNVSLEQITIDGPSFSKKTLLKKNLTPVEQLLIGKLRIDELEIEVRHSRHYPLGEQVAPLIGFYGTDGAQEGLEKSYDSLLSGVQGKQKYYQNARQEIISKPTDIEKISSGKDIQLTIDSTIQFYTYKYLVEAIKNNRAKAGVAVVLDNKKGEVLAIASYPSYNPNNRNRAIKKNRVLVEAYEFGSVLKPIVFSKAVDLNIINPDDYMDVPRRFQLGNKLLIDPIDYVRLTGKEIIAYSSQVGASKIALLLGYDNLKKNYIDFGFSRPISINFPSASFGFLDAKESISDRDLAGLGYGYGLEVSPFQVAVAYSAFANKGILKDFKLLMNDETVSRRVISESAALHTIDALQKVVKIGTGKKADIKGYKEAGKTGTAHKTKSGSGYAEYLYRASFVGIAPIAEESLTILVLIEEPGLNAYSGGAIAAPLFKKIAESSLNYLGYIEDE